MTTVDLPNEETNSRARSSQPVPSPVKKKLGGLVNKKERWSLSWSGWLLAFAILLVGGVIFVLTIFPFLAETQRADTDILVVEGWVPFYVMEAAAKEFKEGHYKQAYTTGGPVQGMGGYTNDYNTSASVGAGLLKAAGVPREQVQMAPSRVINRDRTYTSAIALRDYFSAHNLHPRAINVLTAGAHARRTRLLFQEAFGQQLEVGVISVTSPDYDAKHWWRYSESVRDVISELPAYFYARIIFSAP